MQPFSKIISIDEGEIRNHLDQMVKKNVEDTLNSLLDAEADALCKTTRYVRYSRFFQPVDLVFQLADLAVKFRFSLLQGLRFVILSLREDLGKILEEGLLPLGYLVWMNAVFRAYFRQCALFPKSFKDYFSLECRIVSLSHDCICALPEFVPPGLSYHLRPWSSFRGVAQCCLTISVRLSF